MNIPRIDTEFQSLVHPLTHEEKAGLEQQLLTDGCLDPLRVWQEENILLDGHNRFDLCTLHNIPFKTEYLSLKNRDAALLWIVCNQLSRRNSTEEQKSYLRGKRYELEKKAQGEHEGNQYTKVEKDQIDPLPTTAEKLAKEFGVSAPTIKRDEQFAKGVDAIAKAAPEVKQEILAGKSELTKEEVRSMATVTKQAEQAVRTQTILTTEDEIQKRIDAEATRRAQEQFQALLRKKQEKREAQKEARKEVASVVEEINPVVTPEQRKPRSGEWWTLGRHQLFCGDTASEAFTKKLSACAFAFADPPYNADAAEWDNNFNWRHDYLLGYAKIVAVTPGIVSIFDFARITDMTYLWSVACIITNGMTRGAVGFGNWIYTAIFSHGSIYRNAQDIISVSIKTSETNETSHKGRKPAEFLITLFERFTEHGDTIIDPFLGSGQTLLVCEKIGRVCVGGEISPEFCAEIITRWESLTGEKAHADAV
jgi:hypothetical protein